MLSSAPHSIIASAGNPATQFLHQLARGDLDAIERLLAPDVWFRALLPRGFREINDAGAAMALVRKWFGPPRQVEILATDHHTMRGREYFWFRSMMELPEHPGALYLMEQTGYMRVRDGRISRLDLTCTGLHPLD